MFEIEMNIDSLENVNYNISLRIVKVGVSI